MQDQNKKSPVVLLITEGINLSSSWQGNTLLSAKPSTIFDLWSKFPHTIISSDNDPDDDKSDFITMATGHKSISDSDYLKSLIESRSFHDTRKLNVLYDTVIKHKAALHLIGLIDSNHNSEAKSKIFAMLELAKSKQIYRVFLHLILRDDYGSDSRQLLSNINEIELFANRLGVGEIASIVGINYIKNGSSPTQFKSTLQSIVSGIGLHALSFDQAITLHKSKSQTISDKAPVSITYQSKAIGKFNTFDSLIFFDNDSKYLSDFILYLSQNVQSKSSLAIPKFLSLATFFESIDQKYNNVVYLFQQDYNSNFSKQLAKNGQSQFLITDSSRIQHFNSYLLNNNIENDVVTDFILTNDVLSEYFDNYSETLNTMYSKLANVLQDDKYDFIIIDIPAIYHACRLPSFELSIRMIKIVDNFIKRLYLLVFEKDGALLITSVNNSKLIKSQGEKNYYSPFIFAMKDINKDITHNPPFQNQLMLAILRKTHSLNDICPTLYDIFGLISSNNFSGKSLLDKKILY